MNDNNIPNLRALESELGKISTLETIYLEGNPCQREDQGGYRRKIMLALPQVKQIDATYVSLHCFDPSDLLIVSLLIVSLVHFFVGSLVRLHDLDPSISSGSPALIILFLTCRPIVVSGPGTLSVL